MYYYFAHTGCRVAIWDVNIDGLEVVAKEIEGAGGEAHPYKCNLRDRTEIYKVAKKLREEVGEVTLLVNNAGIVTGKKLLDTNDEEILATFDVNSLAHFWVCFCILQEPFKNWGGEGGGWRGGFSKRGLWENVVVILPMH